MRPNQWPWWFSSLFLQTQHWMKTGPWVSPFSVLENTAVMWTGGECVAKRDECKSVSVDVSVNRPWLYLTGCLSTEACAGLCDSLEPVNVTQSDLWPRYHVGLGHCIEHLALELWRQTGLQSGCWSQCGHTEQLYNIWAQWSLSWSDQHLCSGGWRGWVTGDCGLSDMIETSDDYLSI